VREDRTDRKISFTGVTLFIIQHQYFPAFLNFLSPCRPLYFVALAYLLNDVYKIPTPRPRTTAVKLCGSAPSIALEASATELDGDGDELVVDEDELIEIALLELLLEEAAIVELLLPVVFVSVVLSLTIMDV
jgi:hypothetical protein